MRNGCRRTAERRREKTDKPGDAEGGAKMHEGAERKARRRGTRRHAERKRRRDTAGTRGVRRGERGGNAVRARGTRCGNTEKAAPESFAGRRKKGRIPPERLTGDGRSGIPRRHPLQPCPSGPAPRGTTSPGGQAVTFRRPGRRSPPARRPARMRNIAPPCSGSSPLPCAGSCAIPQDRAPRPYAGSGAEKQSGNSATSRSSSSRIQSKKARTRGASAVSSGQAAV